MTRFLRICAFCVFALAIYAPASLPQSSNLSSLTAISPPDAPVPIPIFAISRRLNIISVLTVDPGNPDEYSQQSNQVGATVTIANVTVDPANAANGTFAICGPAQGCPTPTTASFSYLSSGPDFSASSPSGLGLTAVNRSTACPLIPTAYFSFCGDGRPGAGISYPGDGSLLEVISTQDSSGTMVWASSLGDGNTGTSRVTGCEQLFIESGNEWRIECDYMRRFGGSLDIDMKNDWFVLDVGDGVTPRGVGGELAMSGTRNLASFGIHDNRTVEFDMGASPSGSVMPSSGILRFRNGSTVCWENAGGSNGLCQSTSPADKFSFDGGVVTPTYSTSTACASQTGQCGSAAAGSFTVPAGSASIVVNTTAVTAQSQIFVQEDTSLNSLLGTSCNPAMGRMYQVTGRAPGVGFTISASTAPAGTPACLSYHIMN